MASDYRGPAATLTHAHKHKCDGTRSSITSRCQPCSAVARARDSRLIARACTCQASSSVQSFP